MGQKQWLTIIVTAVITAAIVGGSVYLWQKKNSPQLNIVNNAARLYNSTNTTSVKTSENQQVGTLEVGSITLQNLQSIAACSATVHQLPTKNTQEQLGIKSLLESGYEMIDACREGNEWISFLLAKKDTGACLDACDRIVFGTVDIAKKAIVTVLSQHRLGIYAEAYDQFCRIDTIVASGLSGNKLYLYCGSGESGGFTNWYTYSFGDDSLIRVQSMTELGPPEVFDVKNADLLKKFRYKSNAEMQ
ncbi:MAG: hypothetical protein UX17_C0048G0008 [Parcubacteria group bacterium GW2011_GWC2_45_7]|nr:MAG: hypothetical protein UX17_C0048G0008 [Parcubacteria group bacterium GW2011_GWC2_45_7]KKU71913.1 MAG: hypothetical protein UX98_C0021G0007 [Parcubacteria group bacterium GW2011_GWA2_47_26]